MRSHTRNSILLVIGGRGGGGGGGGGEGKVILLKCTMLVTRLPHPCLCGHFCTSCSNFAYGVCQCTVYGLERTSVSVQNGYCIIE